MKKSIAVLCLLAAGSLQAAPVTIDFEGLPTYFGTASHSEDGFTLVSNQPDGTLIDNNNLIRGALGAPGTGSDSLTMFWGANGANSTLTLTNDGGDLFDLLSFDASSLFNSAGSLTLTGTLSGGGTISQVLTLSSDLTNYVISGMNGLQSLEFSFDGSVNDAPYDLDNINVNAIPIPAAVWLFMSGLGLLGVARRRS